MLKKFKKLSIFIILSLFFLSCNKKNENNQVNIYMWGGSNDINKFMDQVVSPLVLKNQNIELKRVPMVDVKDTINKLVIEKQAGKKSGTVDILWINGENFKTLKDAEILEDNILLKVENKKYLKESTMVKDFGEPINNLEIPFGEAQFNFIYNQKNGKIPFSDFKSLEAYVKNNPGKFTYPAVTNFTGSAFVRNIAIDILGLENIQNMSNVQLEKELSKVWKYLNEIEPYLWYEGKTYPESEGKLDLLYSVGDIDINMGYTINKVNTKIKSKEFPETSKSFLLEKGTLFNNHYLAIPKNSKNKEKALVVINELISPQIQLLKQSSENWGDFTVLDLEKVSESVKIKFNELDTQGKMVPLETLASKRIYELEPSKVKIIDEGWIKEVGEN